MTGTQWISRIAALLLLVLAVALLPALLVAPYLAWRSDARAAIETERQLLGRYQALIDEARQLPDAPNGTVRQQTARLFLSGATDAARAATLQGRLSDLARQEGVRFDSVRGLPLRDRDDLRMLGAELRFGVRIDALQRFLVALERAEPVLVVEALHITAPSAGGATRGNDNARLEIKLDVLAAATRRTEGARP